jgi:NDP-sugar pyrophosphorylase family protein
MKETCVENEKIMFSKEYENEKIEQMPVLVLCGGKGTRLSEITNNEIPKSLVQISEGITILDHLLDGLNGQGFRKYIFCLGQMSNQIVSHLEEKNRKANSEYFYSIEQNPLGTGGAINLAINKFSIDKPFLLVTSDAIFPYEKIKEMVLTHKKSSILWAVTSNYYAVSAAHVSLVVDLENNVLIGNRLTNWINKERENQLQNQGKKIHVFNDSGHGVIDPLVFTKEFKLFTKLADYPEMVCWYKDLLPMIAEKSRRNIIRQKEPIVFVFDEKTPYIDMGTPERLIFARKLISQS